MMSKKNSKLITNHSSLITHQMAYGLNYTMRFKNRISNDIYRAEIWQKDFSGTSTELTGAETPLTVAYQDNDILTPIKPIELTLSILIKNSDGISLETFYSDDDEEFRIDIYCETPTDKLLYSTYMVQDGASEPETDRKHVLTLKATDNLALLKNVNWNQISNAYTGKYTLKYFIQYCLKQSGLYSPDSVIDMGLPLRHYCNIFENTTLDRGDSLTTDPLNELVLNAGIFRNDDETYQSCYDILTKILTDLNAVLFMADGCFIILRINEYKYFSGAIPGVQYAYSGSAETVTAITLTNRADTARIGGDLYPVNEDQNKTIERPLKSVIDTFNFNQFPYIINAALALPDGATPYSTTTSGGFRYDRYSLATYFPQWKQTHGDSSYLQIVTSVSNNAEQDRYIVTPGVANAQQGIQFNPIEVTAGDVLDFSLNYRTDVNTSSTLRFWVRAIIILSNGTSYHLVNTPAAGSSVNVHWNGPYANTSWDADLGFYQETAAGSSDTTEYIQFSISGFVELNGHLPLIPADGVLLVEVRGTNGSNTSNRQTTYWKDINLTIKNNISNSIYVSGQVHTDTNNPDIKAIQTNDITIDDSPRNTIAGTLFTNALSNFDYTDSTTGGATGIGNIYFTKTRLWHRGSNSESLRLGNIIALERLQLLYTSRYSREGTYRIIRYGQFVSLLTLFQFDWLPGRNFLARGMTIDFMANTINGKLVEVYNDGEDATPVTVELSGSKLTDNAVISGPIQFDTINYVGGADAYITVSNSNSRFTYINFNTTVTFSAIFYCPIAGTGTATITVYKNATALSSQTVNATDHYKRVDFNLTGVAVTNGDYFEIDINTGGADIDFQSGSIDITVNGATATSFGLYSFKYLYKKE
jgi:hypothetical protein